jgi:hypothetical protein
MKKQYKFLMLSCSLFILTISLSKAQGNDYIINNSGEKIYGEIHRTFDFNNYETIRFRKGTNEEIAYSPKDIEGFGLENGRYFLSLDLPELEEKVFAQIIFSGKLNLISYKSRYFIETSDQIIELKSTYNTIDGFGRQVKNTNRKPYLGILNLVMAGYCGTELKSSIILTGFNEQDFIAIFQKYHLCEDLPYVIHVEKIPFLKISPVVGLGFNISNQSNSFADIGRYDVFENNLFPMVQAGIKLYGFRKAPRFSFDASIGFTSQNNTVNSEIIEPGVNLTGTETYQLSSVFLPIFFNHSLFSNGNFETYVGIGGALRINKFESDFAMIDYHTENGEVTLLFESPIFRVKNKIFSPAAKIGTHFRSKSRIGIISELQVDYLNDAYSIDMFQKAIYNEIMFSFLIGVRF